MSVFKFAICSGAHVLKLLNIVVNNYNMTCQYKMIYNDVIVQTDSCVPDKRRLVSSS